MEMKGFWFIVAANVTMLHDDPKFPAHCNTVDIGIIAYMIDL